MASERVVGLVLHFRTPERTLACLKSLLDEGVRHVVVVDNSEDGGRSFEAMAIGLSALQASGLRLTPLCPAHNLGFAAGVSTGLEHVRATHPSHVLLINSDAAIAPGALVSMRKLLTNAGCVTPRLAQASAIPQSSFAYYHRMSGLIVRRSMRGRLHTPAGVVC